MIGGDVRVATMLIHGRDHQEIGVASWARSLFDRRIHRFRSKSRESQEVAIPGEVQQKKRPHSNAERSAPVCDGPPSGDGRYVAVSHVVGYSVSR